jgi:hypothetical protein
MQDAKERIEKQTFIQNLLLIRDWKLKTGAKSKSANTSGNFFPIQQVLKK